MKTALQAMKNQLRKQRIEQENQSRDEGATEGYGAQFTQRSRGKARVKREKKIEHENQSHESDLLKLRRP